MPFWRASDRVTLASLDDGDKFRLCRNGLRYKLIDKKFSKARARVKAIGHQVGVLAFNAQLPPTLNKNCHVIKL